LGWCLPIFLLLAPCSFPISAFSLSAFQPFIVSLPAPGVTATSCTQATTPSVPTPPQAPAPLGANLRLFSRQWPHRAVDFVAKETVDAWNNLLGYERNSQDCASKIIVAIQRKKSV
jgi:hypothetical protein